MKAPSFMFIAGEPSGDLLGAELIRALRQQLLEAGPYLTPDYQPLYTSLAPRFFGAGGPAMASAGMELAADMTGFSVIGLSDVLRNYFKFRRVFHGLMRLALEREPDAIICIDFSGFNRRFAGAIKTHVRRRRDWFHDWDPKLIQYVSPQVWASREGRTYQMARDFDLLLSILPFEKEWYARKAPRLPVEFVGNPLVERYSAAELPQARTTASNPPTIVLLPGSRPAELTRHIPVLTESLGILRRDFPALRAVMVLPNEALMEQAKSLVRDGQIELRSQGLAEALRGADLALASTGTVTLECALFGVPTVALYKTSWSTYEIGKRIVRVKFLAMPNILANEQIFPEFIQQAATAVNIARAGLELLKNEELRRRVKARLREIVGTLGGPGASRRAARAILGIVAPASDVPVLERTV